MPPVLVVPGIDTINVANVDLTQLGHGYIAEHATSWQTSITCFGKTRRRSAASAYGRWTPQTVRAGSGVSVPDHRMLSAVTGAAQRLRNTVTASRPSFRLQGPAQGGLQELLFDGDTGVASGIVPVMS